MNDNILMAIESLCDDIASNTAAADNRLRAEAISLLAASGKMVPDEAAADALETLSESRNLPKSGEHFSYNGIDYVALGVEQGGVLAVAVKPLNKEMPYDNDGSNDWRKSTLRKHLNEEYIKEFNKGDLLPFVSDLTSEDGLKDYGTSEDYIFLLSCDLYRKYRPFMPKYDPWTWTITPCSCAPGDASFVRFVLPDGSLDFTNAYYAHGVAPACLFNPSVFE